MGNRSTKSTLRDAVIYLSVSADHIRLDDDLFWAQFWSREDDASARVSDITAQEIRILRDGSPRNFSALVYKMVEKLMLATRTLCNSHGQQSAVLNATRILTRLIPAIFEDESWADFFINNSIVQANVAECQSEPELIYPNKNTNSKDYTAYLPTVAALNISDNDEVEEDINVHSSPIIGPESSQILDVGFDIESEKISLHSNHKSIEEESLIKILVLSICDLLFCPEFTVLPHNDGYLSKVIDAPPEDIRSLCSYDYVWEPGVGFESDSNSTSNFDDSRSELLRLLMTCFSSTLYVKPYESSKHRNVWIEIFASDDNRHALPLFTSLLNTIFSYRPQRTYPFNSLIYESDREKLVTAAIQVMITTLDYKFDPNPIVCDTASTERNKKNLFIDYISRIHREDDFAFIISGFVQLLNDGIDKSYILNSPQLISFDQELLVLFWKICNINQKFTQYLLGSRQVIDIVVPILYRLNDNFQDSSKTARIHVGIFILLMLSGKRNFGVRMNKAYPTAILPKLPTFTGSHADLIIILFHKLILYGHNIYQLFDYMLTILVNISPYLKALSMIASNCLMQLFEIFSSPYVIFTEPNHHQLVVSLYEVFNNIIQYQFDGNPNLICAILLRRELFSNLANLPTTQSGIQKVLNKLKKKETIGSTSDSSSDKVKSDRDNYKNATISSKICINSLAQLGSRAQSCNIMKIEARLVSTPQIESVIEATTISNESEASENETSRVSSCNSPNQSSWRPTPEIMRLWKQSLPMQTTLKMIEVLCPQLERFEIERGGAANETDIVNFLQSGTLVGLLPVPHPIIIRKYRPNDDTTIWFRTCTWAVIYVRNIIWVDTKIKLIKVLKSY